MGAFLVRIAIAYAMMAHARRIVSMIELMLVVGGIALLAGMSLLVLTVPPITLAYACAGLLALGFAVGLPAGFWYHVLLRRALVAQGDLPARWYVSPFSHHDRLDDDQLARLRPWWMVGGVGFLLIVLALALTVVVLVAHR